MTGTRIADDPNASSTNQTLAKAKACEGSSCPKHKSNQNLNQVKGSAHEPEIEREKDTG